MLLSFLSITLFSSLIAASLEVPGPVTSAWPEPARPTVVVESDGAGPLAAGGPDELAVPKELVPGAVVFAEFPAPLGSFAELLRPPTLAGPFGTPLTEDVPAPAEPALGVPAADPPPPFWANALSGESRMARRRTLADNETDIGVLRQ
jgi:hypothetical protein